jgi:hypothetical protein
MLQLHRSSIGTQREILSPIRIASPYGGARAADWLSLPDGRTDARATARAAGCPPFA